MNPARPETAPTGDDIRAKCLENWRRRSITNHSMHGSIVDQVTEKQYFRRRTSDVHKDSIMKSNIIANAMNNSGQPSTQTLGLPKGSTSKLSVSQNSGSNTGLDNNSSKLNSNYCLQLLDKQMTEEGGEINTPRGSSLKVGSRKSNQSNEDARSRQSAGPGDTIQERQYRARRKSIHVQKPESKPTTTPSGNSQYPLPGSHISTVIGGNYTTTKTIHNLLSHAEMEEIIEKEGKKKKRRGSIFDNVA